MSGDYQLTLGDMRTRQVRDREGRWEMDGDFRVRMYASLV